MRDLAELDAWIARARAAGVVAFDAETDALRRPTPASAASRWRVAPGEACYIPLGHAAAEGLALESDGRARPDPAGRGMERLKPLLEDPTVLKVAHNAKYDIAVFRATGSTWPRSRTPC